MGHSFTETALNQSNEKCTFDSKRKRLDFNSFQSSLRQQTIKDFYKPKGSHSENPHSCSCNSNNQYSSRIPKSETNSLEATSSLKKLFQWHKHPQSPKKNTAGHSSSTCSTPITTALTIFMKCPSKVMQVIQKACKLLLILIWTLPLVLLETSNSPPISLRRNPSSSDLNPPSIPASDMDSLYTAPATQNTSSPPNFYTSAIPLNVGWSFNTKHRKIYLRNAVQTAKAHVQTRKQHLEFRQGFQ